MGYEVITDEKYHCLYKYAQPIQVPNRKMVGREKELRSIRAAMNRPELCNVLLLGEAGSGKSCKNGTLVPVADDRGYVPIEDIEVGDSVFDENGMPTKVLGVFPQGMQHAYEVTFKDGTSVVCNDEHLWAARTVTAHHKGYPYRVHTLSDMVARGIVSVRQSGPRRGLRLYRWYVPCGKAVERDAVDFKLDPYVVGVLLGDGCLRDPQLSVSSNDEFVVSKVSSLLDAAGYERNEHNYTWHFLRQNPTSRNKFIMTRELVDLLPDGSQLAGHKSLDRRIPFEYFLGSIEQRYALLQGLMDTDGCITGNGRLNCSFATNNRLLANDVRQLAASLGIHTTLTCQVRDDGVHANPEYEVYFIISDDDKHMLFTLPRHLEKIDKFRRSDRKFNKHYDDICITDVKDLHAEYEMTCLYVDSPSHLFQVTENHIVTHNTMLVQSTMMSDPGKLYLEVDLAKMVANCSTDVNQMAAKLKSLFDDVARYVNTEKQEVVLFMDEFHQVVQLSDAAVEALKPLLADSGVRGIRVITATTPVEFRRHISPNQPLVERLQRINLAQTDKATTISILKGMAERYGVADQFYNDSLYESIYEYTNRYIPANAQPRKSILILDAMIGWHRAEGRKLDKYLLADVIYESEGVNVAFKVDASKIKARLDKKVLSQQFATSVLEQRLQLCVADLNNKGRPMSSLLFSGSSGSGKAVTYDTPMPVMSRNGSDFTMTPAQFVRVGDYLFDRQGRPTKVLGVFPQGRREVYRVMFADGRHVDVSDNHLWGVYENDDKHITVRSTLEIMEDCHRYSIPVNGALQLAGDGSVEMRRRKLEIMSDLDNIVKIHRDDIRSILDVSVLGRSLGLRVNVVEFERCWELEWSEYQGDRIYISSIKKLGIEKDMFCFYVDNDEHLFQVGQFIVTHNTEMAKQLAEILFDDDRSLLRMDMTEYANNESLERFRRELTARAWEHPHSIILLDEIEKACSPVTRLLLQVLDDGRLIDENNREVSFTNAYIIMTTNAGSEIYKTIAQYAADDTGSGASMKRYDKLIRNSISTTTGDNRFPPELLGRIDAIVPFQPLSEETMKNIARMKLQQLRRTLLEKHGVKVAMQEKVVQYLVEDNLDTDSDSGGARTVVAKLESEVTTKIAKFVNENPGVYNIRVVVEGKLASEDENKLVSDAYINVVPVL